MLHANIAFGLRYDIIPRITQNLTCNYAKSWKLVEIEGFE